MPLLQLTRDHIDHSTDRGYQFEFFCDRCGMGFMSEFRPLVMAMAGGAGSGHSGSTILLHDKIFVESMEEVRRHLRECPGCGQWVCADSCWNTIPGVCRNCAPAAE